MNKMRDDFDAWYELNGKSKPFTTVSIKEKMFESWKSSRESMAVEFPAEMTPEYEGDGYKSRYDAAYCEGYNKALSDVENAIESAGITVV